uniref:Uncharacterized protein n=1 Tax=Entomoneis paludosa TaxID=265537 RepID=A0A7S2Y716_9STRA|mmetsp:Transcript_20475/g.42917  ORF Transcript_20475/g.42917 Transcript_20475/m.42917 type:complete len:300 (+) Transcript_20475:179-1078(+)
MAPKDHNDSTTKRQPPNSFRLSTVSSLYDVGDKGFLTEAEKSLRGMDEDGRGHLTIEQVAGIKEETHALRIANKLLKKWIMAMALAVVVLGLCNILVSIIAVRLSKDTILNTETGLLTVKDHDDVSVMTVGASLRYNFQFSGEDEDRCVKLNTIADMFARTMAGTELTAVIIGGVDENSSAVPTEVRALKPNPDTSLLNQTHVCFGSTDATGEVLTCIDLTDHGCDVNNGDNRRQLSEKEHKELTMAKHQLMHHHLARHLGGFSFLGQFIFAGIGGTSQAPQRHGTQDYLSSEFGVRYP